MPPALVYSEEYDLKLGPHVFPSDKYRRAFELLRAEGVLPRLTEATPELATRDDLLLVHQPGYLDRLLHCRLTTQELVWLEIPWSAATLRAVLYATGGSILAGRLAAQHHIAINLCGGFHHAFPDHGEGFCAINDIAVAIRRLQKDGTIARAMVVDCDVHQGNGTAAIFAGDDSVFTISLHQLNNYPVPKPPSDIDVNLADGVGDVDYLAALVDAVDRGFTALRPDMLWYVAGADPFREDQLGGLALTMAGLRQRDEYVMQFALERHVPVAVVMAGGYARRVEDTAAIHAQTVKVAVAAAGAA